MAKEDNINETEKERLSYQVQHLSTVIPECDRMDTDWHLIDKTEDVVYNLVRVVKSILSIFHGNTGFERVFTSANKDKALIYASNSECHNGPQTREAC